MVKSYKIFIILLILAISVLTYLGSNSYKQIRELEKTAELVMHTLRVETEINNLFSQYAIMQSKVFENKLLKKSAENTLLLSQKQNAFKTFKDLNVLTKDNIEQQKKLKELTFLQEAFYKSLQELNTDVSTDIKNDKVLLNSVSILMDKIKMIKGYMLNHEEALLKKQQDQFLMSRRLNPIMTLILGMFALIIFLISRL